MLTTNDMGCLAYLAGLLDHSSPGWEDYAIEIDYDTIATAREITSIKWLRDDDAFCAPEPTPAEVLSALHNAATACALDAEFRVWVRRHDKREQSFRVLSLDTGIGRRYRICNDPWMATSA